MRRRTPSLNGRLRSGRSGPQRRGAGGDGGHTQGVEAVLVQLKVEQEQLEQQMYDLLSLPNPTEVQNEYYAQLKASHTGVLARQTALHHTLLDLAEQVRQGREVRQNDMPHLSTLRSGNAAVTQAQLGAELGAGLVASQELRRRREEEEALEWAKADSLRESRAEAKTAGGAASEAAFEQQLLQAAEESLQRPPPHPDHDEVAEALRQSEWTAAEAARAAAAEEARELEELRSAEAASRSEELGVDDDEELRRACADSLTSSRVRCAHACILHPCLTNTHTLVLHSHTSAARGHGGCARRTRRSRAPRRTACEKAAPSTRRRRRSSDARCS